MNYNKLALSFCLLIWCQVQQIYACRYNIRETGFVDLDSNPYLFYGYVSMDTPGEIILKFDQIFNSAFANCNVNAEIINIDRQKDHEALKYLSLWQIKSTPAAILVSPDGQSLLLDITEERLSFEKSLQSAINRIVYSPIRNAIIKEVIDTYGVILLIEGEDPYQNEKYKKEALSAIEAIKNQMKVMVKSIDYPPVLITLKTESIQDEEILLWSLGMDKPDKKPCAAVFYGKARWIGPLMRNEEISEANFVKILSIVGLDCECGLDVSWVEGTMLPVKWDEKRQAQVAGLLGFDPENPLVKLEVNRILKMASSSYPGVPVTFTDSLAVRSDLDSEGYIVDNKGSYLRIPLYFTLSLIAIIITASLIILIKAKKG